MRTGSRSPVSCQKRPEVNRGADGSTRRSSRRTTSSHGKLFDRSQTRARTPPHRAPSSSCGDSSRRVTWASRMPPRFHRDENRRARRDTFASNSLDYLRRWGSPIRVLSGFVVVLLACAGVRAQQGTTAPAARPAQAEPRKDALGRDTPRGTLLGFMSASRQANDAITPQYLNTNLRDKAAVDLAHELYLVLDRRLPARLDQLSDRPEGSLTNPLKPDQDIIGTVESNGGPVEITVERVTRRGSDPVWLFSRKTLESIPEIYDEVALVSVERYVPAFLAKTRIAGIRLFEWLVF